MEVIARPEVAAAPVARADEVLSPAALDFVARLHGELEPERRALLARRADRQAAFDTGELPAFLDSTRSVREGDWRVASPPRDLEERKVEITGPVDRKMMINALNSGASGFMADFEDSCSPTWSNVVTGQVNLIDAVEGTLALNTPEGRSYRLDDEVATLLVRPRGWHLEERHAQIDGESVSASLFDFGLFVFHNAARLLERGSGPYLYLPKLESHLEARLWREAFAIAEQELDLPRGSIKATVLIETVLAAFEMDEILWELREHSPALNAGRWDYIFSAIKKFRERPDFVLPDRAQVTMTVPFMSAYTSLLVRRCHARGAHAMGGMAAFIPSRRDPELNEVALAKVRDDKRREAGDGFDGTWVAHPDLVPVAREELDRVLGARPNQVEHRRDDVEVGAEELVDVAISGGSVTGEGLRSNVSVALRYLDSWLQGTGAVAIFNLMEDVATAEIARAQVWQWTRHGVRLENGRTVTPELVRELADEELQRLRKEAGAASRADDARALFEQVALGERFTEFLTLPAYESLD
ncbi:MAG: malate synthase A [Gaiellaceae bacterium]